MQNEIGLARSSRWIRVATASLMACIVTMTQAQTTPDPAEVVARKHKSDPTLNFLTYQHMDKLYNTRLVPAGNDIWVLPQSQQSLGAEFEFDVDGKRTTLIEFLADTRVNALLVLKDGEIVTEIYRHGSSSDTRFIAMSMAKSFISALYGVARQEGFIKSIDDAIVRYLPELEGTAYDGATIRNLLMMRSGVEWDENDTGLAVQRTLSLDEEKVYYEDHAFKAKVAVRPGSKFNYSSLDAQVLGWALSRAVGRSVADYMAEQLWVPAGMEHAGYWTMQGPSGKQREFYAAGFNATLRDYGRFGQLMLNGGTTNGKQIVPLAWVEESTSRGVPPQPYMYQWWGRQGETDYAAVGYRGQQIYVDPTTRTVVVILSYFAGTEGYDTHTPMLQAIKNELQETPERDSQTN